MSGDLTEAADYQLFGLRIRSEIPLPELFAAEGSGAPQVTISRSELDNGAGISGLQLDGDAFVLNVPDVARYRIRAGAEILVDAVADAPDRNVRLFLLGSAFGALLHQRGMLPLHANAVEIDGKAIAFMGESGAGKSTLAAWFHDRGHRIIADDVCVVGFDEHGQPLAAPGLPRFRLWAQALELMGRQTSDYPRSYVGEDEDKYDVPVASESAAQSSLPLSALYLLDRAKQSSVRQLSGVEAAEAVFANTYRGSYVSLAGGQQAHWEAALRLVQTVPLYRAARIWDVSRLDEQNHLLLDHAAASSDSHEREEAS